MCKLHQPNCHDRLKSSQFSEHSPSWALMHSLSPTFSLITMYWKSTRPVVIVKKSMFIFHRNQSCSGSLSPNILVLKLPVCMCVVFAVVWLFAYSLSQPTLCSQLVHKKLSNSTNIMCTFVLVPESKE